MVTGGCVIAAAGEVKASTLGLICMVLAVTVRRFRSRSWQAKLMWKR